MESAIQSLVLCDDSIMGTREKGEKEGIFEDLFINSIGHLFEKKNLSTLIKIQSNQ